VFSNSACCKGLGVFDNLDILSIEIANIIFRALFKEITTGESLDVQFTFIGNWLGLGLSATAHVVSFSEGPTACVRSNGLEAISTGSFFFDAVGSTAIVTLTGALRFISDR